MPMEHGSGREQTVGLALDVSHLRGLELARVLAAAAKRGEDLRLYDLSHLPESIEDDYDSADSPLCGDCLYSGCEGCDK
jgi:hypothetical protein